MKNGYWLTPSSVVPLARCQSVQNLLKELIFTPPMTFLKLITCSSRTITGIISIMIPLKSLSLKSKKLFAASALVLTLNIGDTPLHQLLNLTGMNIMSWIQDSESLPPLRGIFQEEVSGETSRCGYPLFCKHQP